MSRSTCSPASDKVGRRTAQEGSGLDGVYLGVDVGTSSTKGVLVDHAGTVIAQTGRQHRVDNPRPGQFEMDGAVWWDEFVSITGELLRSTGATVAAVGVSGMGP